MDHSHAINLVIEKCAEYNKPLYMAFIDYEKAFESIEIQEVLEALRRKGVPDIYVQTRSNIYEDCTATLLRERSKKILIKRGVGQGDMISPMLFAACLEEVFKKGIRIDGEYLSNARFTDDIVLFSNDTDQLQNMIMNLNWESLKLGIKMKRQKIRIMLTSLAKEQEFKINNEPLESLNE